MNIITSAELSDIHIMTVNEAAELTGLAIVTINVHAKKRDEPKLGNGMHIITKEFYDYLKTLKPKKRK
jgi:hypothetical protein